MSVFFTSMEDVSMEPRSLSAGCEKSASAPTTPTETTRLQAHGVALSSALKRRSKGHRVNFPTDDCIVTGYVEPPNPWSNAAPVSKSEDLLEVYQVSCQKHGVEPLSRLVQQLEAIGIVGDRTQDLNLKGEKLDARQCEAMEDIFKAMQFDSISLEACHLDDEGAATVFDMIEYYESARKLNISHNRNIDSRGWQACSRMLKKTPCLQHLDARGTALSEQTLLILGRALRLGSHLNSLHLENCSLTGRSLVILVAALKLNPALKELYLGDNGMTCADGLQLANLLRANTRLEYLDLRGNGLQDIGVSHLSDGIAQQPDSADKGLKTLVLWSNGISPAGMRHISRALVATKSLITLNLGHNAIGDDGLLVLREALMRNKSLCNLGLQNTKITCEGAIALAEFIADSQIIVRLDLRENNIGVGGLMALAQSLKLSRSVTRLDLDQVKSENDAKDSVQDQRRLLLEIGEQCRRNKRLLRLASVSSVCNGISDPNAPSLPDLANSTVLANGTIMATAAVTTQARPPFSTSLSVNAVTGGNAAPPSSPGTSRFRVSRVCLETDAENGPAVSENPNTVQLRSAGADHAAASVNLERSYSAPASVPSRFTVTPVNGFKPAMAGTVGIAVEKKDESVTSDTAAESNEHDDAYGHNHQNNEVEDEDEDDDEDDFVGHAVSKPVTILTASGACRRGSADDFEEGGADDEGGQQDEEEEDAKDSLSAPPLPMPGRTSPTWFVYPSVSTSAQPRNGIAAPPSSGGMERKRKISFQLPEGTTGEGGRLLNGRADRRMSTPAMPVSNSAARKKLTALKLCKRLESLDLRSTVPLSPTRLLEGWAFPEPSVDFKYPSE
ncbi:protein phosphatase 1 regulatory subunit 37-like [Dermacentor albipictus]|uniref:protein phosphatase 1 regulatory subunit 37-like n=1 Tax=Dermacentor albipictus TaxID=60249 RepID=UPI0031FD75B2